MSETSDITRGACRLLIDLGLAPLTEVTLKSGRRLDILALGEKSELVAVEVKSSRQDFLTDQKWPEYRQFCDHFYFAVAPTFPMEILPDDEGLIVADRFGAEIVRPSQLLPVPSARRRSMILKAARLGALRLQTLIDPRLDLDARF